MTAAAVYVLAIAYSDGNPGPHFAYYTNLSYYVEMFYFWVRFVCRSL